jgi:hypothetical protein
MVHEFGADFKDGVDYLILHQFNEVCGCFEFGRVGVGALLSLTEFGGFGGAGIPFRIGGERRWELCPLKVMVVRGERVGFGQGFVFLLHFIAEGNYSRGDFAGDDTIEELPGPRFFAGAQLFVTADEEGRVDLGEVRTEVVAQGFQVPFLGEVVDNGLLIEFLHVLLCF